MLRDGLRTGSLAATAWAGGLLVLAGIASLAACSFAWDDYRTRPGGASAASGAAGPGGAGGSATGAGGCASSEKACGAACVAIDDPAYGCSETGCDPCASFPNATAKCAGGACSFGACLAGYGDCDADGASCEISTQTSSEHCGGCDQPCPGTSCVNGACSAESCTNGLDDDGDGLVDCADPDCVTFACVDAPVPWKGPVFLYDGSFAGRPADCSTVPGTLAYEGFDGVVFDAPTCSACSCGAATASCALSPFVDYTDGACALQLGSTPQPAPPTCTDVAAGTALSAAAAAPTAFGGCPPAGGVVSADPYTWTQAGLACAPTATGGGCATGVCVGNAPPLFGAKPCVRRGGNHACPAGFDDKHVFHDGAQDNRACTACQCGAPNGSGSCSVTTHAFAVAGCSGTSIDFDDTGTCVSVSGVASISTTVTTIDNFGSCAASGGVPGGEVIESGAVTTVCCVP